MLVALLSACGSSPETAPAKSSIKAVIKASALTANMNIAGINLSISVPVGVAPPLLPDGTVDPSATVEITSSSPQSQTLPGATYTPATATAPGVLAISAIIASGFQATDTITLHLNVTPGIVPVQSDFNLKTFEAFDTNGAVVTGLSPTLTTTIQ
jgi:hypothetical protein